MYGKLKILGWGHLIGFSKAKNVKLSEYFLKNRVYEDNNYIVIVNKQRFCDTNRTWVSKNKLNKINSISSKAKFENANGLPHNPSIKYAFSSGGIMKEISALL